MTMQRYIQVKFQKEGIHHYPEAASDPKLADVAFLGHEHSHYFHFVVNLEVFQNNRDVEFIQFRRWLESLYDGRITADNQSCEMLAESLIDRIKDSYPGRSMKVEVYEDNINGAILCYDAHRAEPVVSKSTEGQSLVVRLVTQAIEANDVCRPRLPEGAYHPLDMRTVRLSLGRQMGHSTAITQLAQPGDLVITRNSHNLKRLSGQCRPGVQCYGFDSCLPRVSASATVWVDEATGISTYDLDATDRRLVVYYGKYVNRYVLLG